MSQLLQQNIPTCLTNRRVQQKGPTCLTKRRVQQNGTSHSTKRNITFNKTSRSTKCCVQQNITSRLAKRRVQQNVTTWKMSLRFPSIDSRLAYFFNFFVDFVLVRSFFSSSHLLIAHPFSSFHLSNHGSAVWPDVEMEETIFLWNMPNK